MQGWGWLDHPLKFSFVNLSFLDDKTFCLSNYDFYCFLDFSSYFSSLNSNITNNYPRLTLLGRDPPNLLKSIIYLFSCSPFSLLNFFFLKKKKTIFTNFLLLSLLKREKNDDQASINYL
jgi:hypothetical protein